MKNPGLTTYATAFAGCQAAFYLLTCVLCYTGCLSLVLMGVGFLLACVVFNDVSLLYFGRHYRKLDQSSFFYNWPYLCYTLLTLLDLVLLFAVHVYEANTFIPLFYDHHTLLFLIVAANVMIPMMLVPLPRLCQAGARWGIAFALGCGMFAAGFVILWNGACLQILQMAIMNTRIYEHFIRQTANSFPLDWAAKTASSGMQAAGIFLWAMGNAIYVWSLKRINNHTGRRSFTPVLWKILALCVLVHAAFLGANWWRERQLGKLLEGVQGSFNHKLDTDTLQELYLNRDHADERFWNKVHQQVADAVHIVNVSEFYDLFYDRDFVLEEGLSQQPSEWNENQWKQARKLLDELKEHCAKLDELLENVSVIPKAKRNFAVFKSGLEDDILDCDFIQKLLNLRIAAALHDGDPDRAMALYVYHHKLSQALLDDVSSVADMVRRANLDGALIPLAMSDKLNAEQLRVLLDGLAGNEAQLETLYRASEFMGWVYFVYLRQNMVKNGVPKMKAMTIRQARFILPQSYGYFLKNTLDNAQGRMVLEKEKFQRALKASIAKNRLLQILVACQLYRKRCGALPQDSTALFPDLLPVPLVNPFNDQPIELHLADGQLEAVSAGRVAVILK